MFPFLFNINGTWVWHMDTGTILLIKHTCMIWCIDVNVYQGPDRKTEITIPLPNLLISVLIYREISSVISDEHYKITMKYNRSFLCFAYNE